MFMKARFTPAKTSRIAALRLKGCKPLKNITDAILHYMPESSTSRRFDTIAAPRCDLKSRDLKRWSSQESWAQGWRASARRLRCCLEAPCFSINRVIFESLAAFGARCARMHGDATAQKGHASPEFNAPPRRSLSSAWAAKTRRRRAQARRRAPQRYRKTPSPGPDA